MSERRERFQGIYDDNYTKLLGYALRRTESVDDAHDVVADTFLVAWRRIDELPEGERARLWLYGTARKLLANHYRGRRRHHRLADRLSRERTVESAIAWEASGIRGTEEIAVAFDRLSEPDREILILVGWEQLNTRQLATVLGCTPAAARVRLHRARRRFRNELEAQGLKLNASSGHESNRGSTARHDAEESA